MNLIDDMRIDASALQHPDRVRKRLQHCSSTHLRYQHVPYLQLYHSVQGTKVPHADLDNHCTPALAGLGFSAPLTP